jgi:uncharacterized protein (TIGR03437 family)
MLSLLMKSLAVLFILSGPLFSQTSDSTLFRAVLLPSNEIPALNNASRGIADILASAVRDSSGNIVSGTVDVLLRTTLPAANTITGLNLHNAPAGQAAPIALTTGITAANSRPLQSGADLIHIPIQIITPADVATLTSLLADPTHFYLNVTSMDQPNGLMRGQLQRTQSIVLMGLLDSANVTPPIGNAGAGVAQVVAIGTRDSAGNLTSGEVYIWTTNSSNDPTAINALQIHTGAPGNTGAVAINATVPPAALPDLNGNVALGPVYTEIVVTNATQAGAFTDLFVNPTSLYLDLHTTQNPNGIVRAQLRPTDRATFPLLLGAAPLNLSVYTLRNEDGSVAAATMLCDLNLRLGTPTQILGLWLHDGGLQDDGPGSIKITPDFSSDTGFGNYYAWTAPVRRLDTVQDVLKNPESHYIALHTFDAPTGASRAQLGVRPPTAAVTAALAANLDKTATTLVPGGLATIFGSALNKVPDDLSGWRGTQLPAELNGSRVSIAGQAAPLIYVSPNQINLQVPLDTPSGMQTVTVDNGNGPSAAFNIYVAAAAPAIFFAPVPAVLKNANFSLVSSTNPAHAGETLLVYLTGLGETTPALTTGRIVPADTLPATRPVTATFGGRSATVVYSAASPGFTGLYQVAVTVPGGVTGPVPLQLQMGDATSNIVTISVQ